MLTYLIKYFHNNCGYQILKFWFYKVDMTKGDVILTEKKQRYDDILFLSGIYSEKNKDQLMNPSINSNIQVAADVLQNHLIHGLENCINKPITLINAPFVGAYPRSCRVLYFRLTHFSHCNKAKDINIPFCNLPLLRHFSIYWNSRRYIKKWVKNHPSGTVISYALTLRNIYRLLYAKRIKHTIKTCIVVPDLPMYMRMSVGIIYRSAKSVENYLIKRKLNKVDSYVLLTEQMNEMIKSDHYCVVEGVSTSEFPKNEEDLIGRIVLYSGTLDSKYGVPELLEAFHRIEDPTVHLYICGTGNSQSMIEEMTAKDNRICFLGQLSRQEILDYQSRAAVLVNPRQSIETFTKYSFPSKNLEYLSSGVPLVAYKLAGIPDEYDPYIHYVEDNTIEALQKAIEEVLAYSTQERRAIGEKAKRFVLEYKNSTVQAEKILDMLRNI